MSDKKKPIHGVGTYANAEKGIVSYSFQLDENNPDDLKIMEHFGKYKVKNSIKRAMLEMIEGNSKENSHDDIAKALQALPELLSQQRNNTEEQSATVEKTVTRQAEKDQINDRQNSKVNKALGM